MSVQCAIKRLGRNTTPITKLHYIHVMCVWVGATHLEAWGGGERAVVCGREGEGEEGMEAFGESC